MRTDYNPEAVKLGERLRLVAGGKPEEELEVSMSCSEVTDMLLVFTMTKINVQQLLQTSSSCLHAVLGFLHISRLPLGRIRWHQFTPATRDFSGTQQSRFAIKTVKGDLTAQ